MLIKTRMRRKLIRKYRALNKDFQRSKELFLKWFIPEIKKRVLGVKKTNYKDIPIIINNYNRLEMLSTLIDGLESRGYRNLYILDNQSTYPPLLEYYTRLSYPVYMLNNNVGHLALWKTGFFKQFKDTYYAYTDSDLEIHPDCPDDFIEKFISLLEKYPKALKVGFSICIDDLPDHYKLKNEVIEWEKVFWKEEIEPNIFRALIDTTFAVYKPYFIGEPIDPDCFCIRTGFPYSVRHLPWYINSDNLSKEELYYLEHIKTLTHWSKQNRTNVSTT